MRQILLSEAAKALGEDVISAGYQVWIPPAWAKNRAERGRSNGVYYLKDKSYNIYLLNAEEYQEYLADTMFFGNPNGPCPKKNQGQSARYAYKWLLDQGHLSRVPV